MGSITARIAATIMAILVLAGALRTVLNVSKFDEAFTGLLQSRLSVVVLDVGQTLETSLRLGLSLPALVNAQELLDRERTQDEHILSILVFDRDGRTVFDTDKAAIGRAVPAGWPIRARLEGGRTWLLRDDSSLVVGAPLADSLGEIVGGVALRYDRAPYDAAFAGIRNSLAIAAAVLLALGAVVTYAGVLILFRPLRRRFAELEAALVADDRAAGGHPANDEPAGERAANDQPAGDGPALLADHLAPLRRGLAAADAEIARVGGVLAGLRAGGDGRAP